MLNKKPIFLNCFSRGGSNMLVNLLVSHPNVCLCHGELHKVFKPRTPFDDGFARVVRRFTIDYPIRLVMRQNYFKPNLVAPRNHVPYLLRRYFDHLLYYGRFTALSESYNLYKSEGVEYTREELAQCRLLSKGMNGMVFTVDTFREMYPDAVFFALIRNGLAVCEGRVRRGYSAEVFAHDYNKIIDKMFALEAEMPNYHIFRFEDMLADPLAMLHRLYELAGLEVSALKKVRLESKATLDSSGKHVLTKGRDRQVFWYELSDLNRHIKKDVNKNQLRNIKPEDKSIFLSIAGETMERLNYPTE